MTVLAHLSLTSPPPQNKYRLCILFFNFFNLIINYDFSTCNKHDHNQLQGVDGETARKSMIWVLTFVEERETLLNIVSDITKCVVGLS